MPCAISDAQRERFTPDPQADQRFAERHMSLLRVAKLLSGGSEELCVIKNISSNGAMIRTYGQHKPGEQAAIELDGGRIISGRIVWAEGAHAGIALDESVAPCEIMGRRPAGAPTSFTPRAPRLKIAVSGNIRSETDDQSVEVKDISQGGAKIGIGDLAAVGDTVVLNIKGFGLRKGRVCWNDGETSGVAFNTPIALHDLALWAAQKCAS